MGTFAPRSLPWTSLRLQSSEMATRILRQLRPCSRASYQPSSPAPPPWGSASQRACRLCLSRPKVCDRALPAEPLTRPGCVFQITPEGTERGPITSRTSALNPLFIPHVRGTHAPKWLPDGRSPDARRRDARQASTGNEATLVAGRHVGVRRGPEPRFRSGEPRRSGLASDPSPRPMAGPVRRPAGLHRGGVVPPHVRRERSRGRRPG